MTYNLKLGLTYTGTDFTRELLIPDVEDEDAALETVRGKISAVNASLTGGTADDLADFFLADDGSELKKISYCDIQIVDETNII